MDLSKFLDHITAPAALGPDGQTVALAPQLSTCWSRSRTRYARVQAITVAPVDQSLTTQEAANFLGIQSPHAGEAARVGRDPFERPGAGRHRRVRLQDVVAYQERKRVQRRTALDELTREAADAGLYDSEADYGSSQSRAQAGGVTGGKVQKS